MSVGRIVPSLEEIRRSLPVDLIQQKDDLGRHVEAWLLERKQHEAETRRLLEQIDRLERRLAIEIEAGRVLR